MLIQSEVLLTSPADHQAIIVDTSNIKLLAILGLHSLYCVINVEKNQAENEHGGPGREHQ